MTDGACDDFLAELKAEANRQKALEMQAYHKVERPYLGVSNPVLDAMSKDWRSKLTLDERTRLSGDLWKTNIHEARVAASKLLTQARLRPDDTTAWDLITSWVPDFDAWAIADHACMAGQKRLVWQPDRVAQIEHWHRSEHMWTRRAAFVITLPWTKQNNPKPAELEIRDTVLKWAATLVEDHDWFIQKAIAWWLRELSKHDPDRTHLFLDRYGEKLKPFARKEAGRKLSR